MSTRLHRCQPAGSARSRRRGVRRWAGLVAGLALALCVATSVSAQESLSEPLSAEREEPADAPAPSTDPEPETPPTTPTPAPTGDSAVQLDQLLKLPNTLDFREERIGGAGASDWRRRFRESADRIQQAEAKLAEIEAALDSAAVEGSSQWQIAPPGQSASSETGPLSFRLREELRRARADLDEAERQGRALVVEADLAGVPESWRRPAN